MSNQNQHESMASKGGKAAAANMTPAARKERAKIAAAARWKKPVSRVIKEGELKLSNGDGGEMSIPCAVVDVDGAIVRLISQRGMSLALGRHVTGSGAGKGKILDSEPGVAKLPTFIGAENLKPFISKELEASLTEPMEYEPLHGGRSAYGFRAEMFPQICHVWLKAKDAGVLKASQRKTAAMADILIRGLAGVAMISLVDDATGYKDERDREELVRILQEFVAKEIREWVPTFDNDFYKMIFRLKDWTYSGTTLRPRMLGKITNDLVYRRLAPGLLAELQKLNPKNGKGNRKAKHHQWLTEHRGHPGLIKHLARLTGWGEMSETWDQFMRNVNSKMPIYTGPTLFDGIEEEEEE